MTKNILIIGLTLFALFFGAGNLIFPIQLGWESGPLFAPAILGFLITGVGIPLLGLIASSFSAGGIQQELSERLYAWFSFIFMTTVYLTIGPLFAIPRTATTAYNIGVIPVVGHDSISLLLIFSIFFFSLVLFLSLNPLKMVETIGKYLTPILIIVISALCLKALFDLTIPVTEIRGAFKTNAAFTEGFTQGYLTMDGIAAIAFSIIALQSIKALGVSNAKDILKYCIVAALIAGISLVIIYLSLGWIGNNYPLSNEQINWVATNNTHFGAYILSSASKTIFGSIGPFVVSIIVFLACLTTAIGLIVAISEFFFNVSYRYFPRIKYSFYVYFFTLISFILANQGLNQVISASIPILYILYPIAIAIIFLLLFDKLITVPKIAFRFAIATTTIIAISSVLLKDQTLSLVNYLRLNINNLGLMQININDDLTFFWIIPTLLMLLLGYLVAYIQKIF